MFFLFDGLVTVLTLLVLVFASVGSVFFVSTSGAEIGEQELAPVFDKVLSRWQVIWTPVFHGSSQKFSVCRQLFPVRIEIMSDDIILCLANVRKRTKIVESSF